MKDTCAIVLAAGKGTRMDTDKPKVLHSLAGKPMLFYTLEKLDRAGLPKIIVVVGHKADMVKEAVEENVSFKEKIDFATQEEQKGTADAVKSAMKSVDGFKNTIVVNGDDSAFYDKDTIKEVVDKHKEEDAVVTFVSLEKKDPTGLGRVVRAENGGVKGIVEEKDATKSQKEIKEINAGFYVFGVDWLENNLPKVRLSKTGEYYLVDLVDIAVSKDKKVSVYELGNEEEWYGVNTKRQLSVADAQMRRQLGSSFE